MNNSTSTGSDSSFADGNSTGFLSSQRIGGFGYGLGISVGILILITTITLMSYFCTRANTSTGNATASQARHSNNEEVVLDVEAGLDEATLMSYPKFLYSQAKLDENSSCATCCSICLADYKDSDMLRLLPECGHLFHLSCVDQWLRSHPTCPMCRSSPMPSPMATPLAEVVPLALARR